MTNHSRLSILNFYTVTALFWASLYTYQATMSPYLISVGISYAMIGLIGGAYGLTQMLCRIPLGMLSDRLGRRKIFVVAGVLTAALSALVLYMANGAPALLLGRALAGVAASAWVVFTVLFTGYFNQAKAASRVSFLAMSNNTGQVAAMLAGGVAAGFFGYRFPFMMGVAVGGLALVLSFFIKESVPERKKPPTLRELFSVAKNKNLMIMSLLGILAQIVLFGTSITFTPLVADNLQASGEELGFLSFAGNAPRILAAMLCGLLLTRKINSNRVIALSFVLLAAGSGLTPFCPNLWTLYVASAITGFGSGISMTMLLSLCTLDVPAECRSAAMGFFQAIYGLGMFIGPVAVGIFADGLGMRWGFAFSALVSLVGAVGCGWIPRRT